ncbi:MAG: Fpg/Nei family DNA glycosylase [Thermoanaerobaculia bacterium]
MPEGDTILRAARALEKAIGGREITAFHSPLPRLSGVHLAGRRVEKVEARGKNLLVRLDDGSALLSHMRMTGSWHLYRPGEAWRKPARQARAVLETTEFVAVCFNAPVLELLSERQLARHAGVAQLGPDILESGRFDFAEARRRLRERNAAPIGEALIAQRAVAGIGNIYKSEALFLSGMDPFRTVAELEDAELEALLTRARELMSANLGGRPRAARASLEGGRYWVYGRSGQPCRRCGTRIRMRRQGLAGRSTYWCPTCQPGKAAAES